MTVSVVTALLVIGAVVALAISSYYRKAKREEAEAKVARLSDDELLEKMNK